MENNNIMNDMGFDIKEESKSQEQTAQEIDNNSAENTLITIATITLVIGIIAAVVMLFTVCFVPKYGDHGRTVFNPTGFGMTCGVVISTLISWAALKVFANISITLKQIKAKLSK
ncbi:hypothetical protein L6472_07975 [Prevotella sp. E13-17]|uniref:hypothetical protein n=1 Tax=Prevotella sp. E13-17 TaxID=2913616 RepID=UPI001ED9D6E1|nr:hypothetical protein [Prevotella sp. E13-17]UKK49981.1 hypothetical protein L6472_07975 [Prevotella sp. E13-17]